MNPAKVPPEVVNAGPTDERRLSILGHLEELRSLLLLSALVITVASVVSVTQAGRIIEWLKRPAGDALPTLAMFSPTEALTAYLKVAVGAGFVLALPVLLYALWSFLRPGLTKQERRYGLVFIVCGSGLFLAGVAFAYWVLLPISLTFLLKVGEGMFTPIISVSRYLAFTTGIMFACGVVFELPMAVWLLTRLGLVTPQRLWRWWQPAVVIMLIIAAIVTPTTDAATMLLMTAPMIALYGLAVLVSALTQPKRTRKTS